MSSKKTSRQRRLEGGNATTPKVDCHAAPYLDADFFDEAVFEEAVLTGSSQPMIDEIERRLRENLNRAQQKMVESTWSTETDPLIPFRLEDRTTVRWSRPPFNAEYLLYLFLRKDERDCVIGDLIQSYAHVVERFNKPRADFWFYTQVARSLWPLLRRAIVKTAALVWLGRVLRKLIS
jgi:hypothetical protein